MRSYYWILLIVGALPLLIYPFILLANVLSLAGTKSSTPVPMAQWLIANGFLGCSTLYPLVYLACTIAAVTYARSGKATVALKLSIVPLAYLGVCGLLLMAWSLTG